jgi:predicted nuclease with RNAse H fold
VIYSRSCAGGPHSSPWSLSEHWSEARRRDRSRRARTRRSAAISDRYAGVDIGASQKGFHVALVDAAGLADGPVQIRSVDTVVRALEAWRPSVVALDSPRSCAPDGEKSRPCERELVASGICNIRWTPDRASLDSGNPYYDWIVNGLRLYDALARAASQTGWDVIEVFPTASWTRWAGRRGPRRRAAWSSEALAKLGIPGLPARRLNQDDRDAIAAALTARLHAVGRTENFGEIVVPHAQP